MSIIRILLCDPHPAIHCILMGQFYSNFTLRGPNQHEVVAALTGQTTIVTPEHQGCIVVYDQASEDQDFDIITELGKRLSRCLHCPVLAAVVHDDDILFLQLHEAGEMTDEYCSLPGYFDPDAEPSPPDGGDPQRLCAAFGTSSVSEVDGILRKDTFDDDGLDAAQRHAELVNALGLPPWCVGAGHNYIAEGFMPDGLVEGQLLRTH